MFDETLEQIVTKIDGALGAVILGLDGIPVARAVAPGADDLHLDIVAAEHTALLRKLMRTAADADLGDLHELILAAGERVFVVGSITPEYFLLLVSRPTSALGRARFEIRKARLVLEEEFSM